MALSSLQGLTVRDVLQLEPLKGFRVLAGDRGLDRRITGVTVLEVPDYRGWLQPGELVLTSGYGFKDSPDSQSELVPNLHQSNVGALGIKPKRYLDHVPPVILETAEQVGLPVLEIPYETTWSTIMDAVAHQLMMQSTGDQAGLSRSLDELIRLTTGGATPADLVRACTEMTGHSAVMVDRRRQPAVGSLGGLADSAAVRCIAAALPAQGGTPLTATVTVDGAAVEYHAFPISSGARFCGHLVTLAPAGGLPAQHSLVLAKTADLIGIALHQSLRPDWRFQDQFLQAWLTRMLGAYGNVRNQALAVGVNLAPNYALLLVRPGPQRPDPAYADAVERVRDFLTHYFVSPQRQEVVGATTEGVVYLTRAETGETLDAVQRRAEQRADTILQALRRRFPELKPRVGVGQIHPALEQLPDSYRAIATALDVADTFGLEQEVILPRQVSMYRLLLTLQGQSVAREFVDDSVGILAEYDQRNGTDLVPTLEAYLSSGSIGEVSRKLFTHYNTVRYRLQRIQELTGKDLNQLEDSLKLFLALRLMRITRAREGAHLGG